MNRGFDYRGIVSDGASGGSLLDYLARRYRHSTRGEWGERITAGRVLVDGQVALPGATLRRGQSVVWRRPPWEEPEAPLAWALLHRDPEVLGVAKPAGLPTLPGGGYLENTLRALVHRRYPETAAVHRLDRGTTGVVLFARNAPARERLARDFRAGRIEKTYVALVQGAPALDAFDIAVPIGKVAHARLGSVYAAVPAGDRAGRAARTEFTVLERRGGSTVVQARPITGRPHQIRIHLAAAGLPLVGEPLYAAGGIVRDDAVAAGAVGYHLHAARVGFDHPASGRRIVVECGIPATLRRLV